MLLEIQLWGLPHYKTGGLAHLNCQNTNLLFFFLVSPIRKLYFLLWVVDKENESFSMGGWLLSSKALVNDSSASYWFPPLLEILLFKKRAKKLPTIYSEASQGLLTVIVRKLFLLSWCFTNLQLTIHSHRYCQLQMLNCEIGPKSWHWDSVKTSSSPTPLISTYHEWEKKEEINSLIVGVQWAKN